MGRGKDWKRKSARKLLEYSNQRSLLLEQSCVVLECNEKWLDSGCVWKVEPNRMWCLRGREELIMTLEAITLNNGRGNYYGDAKTVEGAGLEGEDRNSDLNLLNLIYLLDIQVEMNPHYNTINMIYNSYYCCSSCAKYQYRKVNFSVHSGSNRGRIQTQVV